MEMKPDIYGKLLCRAKPIKRYSTKARKLRCKRLWQLAHRSAYDEQVAHHVRKHSLNEYVLHL